MKQRRSVYAHLSAQSRHEDAPLSEERVALFCVSIQYEQRVDCAGDGMVTLASRYDDHGEHVAGAGVQSWRLWSERMSVAPASSGSY